MATESINNVNDIENSENPVSNPLQITNNLLCPLCAKPHMFEYMLKEHLKKCHANINSQNNEKNALKSPENDIDTNKCPFCEVRLVHSILLPKHITKSHGQDLLLLWQHQSGNLKNYQAAKDNEPSILYAACSPGLSNIFDSIIGNYDEEGNVGRLNDTTATVSPQLKSILKKTPNKSRIIFSPAAAAIRRSKSDVVKRSISVRRELRFDPSTKSASESLSPDNSNATNPVAKRSFKFPNPFNFYKKGIKTKTLGNKLITSTPINFLDDDRTDSQANKKNWKTTIRNNRPLFFVSERYQCAYCKKTWESNTELLNHLSDNHKSIKHWLRPQYQCSLCGSTFYSNTYLVRHCHLQHTPVKMTRKIIRS